MTEEERGLDFEGVGVWGDLGGFRGEEIADVFGLLTFGEEGVG